MKTLHIVQGGITNGDKDWLEKAAIKGWESKTWVVPKSASPGDEVVIFIRGFGFFATASIKSVPKPRPDWPNRYGAGLTSIQLIDPPISLNAIQKNIPDLVWATYPRSITTPSEDIAHQVRELIRSRRKTGLPDLDDDSLLKSNIDELRNVALMKSKKSVSPKEQKRLYRARSLAIKLYVLLRANGICEGCNQPAPFYKPDRTAYLEPHHTQRLADDGPDHPAHVIALCPNCHRKAHYSADATAFSQRLIDKLSRIEPS